MSLERGKEEGLSGRQGQCRVLGCLNVGAEERWTQGMLVRFPLLGLGHDVLLGEKVSRPTAPSMGRDEW